MVETIVLFLILIVLAFIANISEKQRRKRGESTVATIASFGGIGLLHVLIFFAGIGAQVGALALRTADTNTLSDSFADAGLPATLAQTLQDINLDMIAIGLWLPSLIGLLVLIPFVRRMLGKVWRRFEPANHVHAIALSLSMLAATNLLITLGVGLEFLSESLAVAAEQAAASGDTSGAMDMLGTAWVQNIMTVLLAMFGVGFIVRRGLSETFDRLGLKIPTLKQVGLAIGLGFVAVLVLGGGITLAESFGLGDDAVNELSEELYAPFFASLWGVVTVGLAAGSGEETFFRGAVQPIFGRFTTAFLFAIVHGNYGFSIVTLAIFLVGYLLGWVRDRYNTTTAMIMHATYNMIQALGAYIVGQNPEWLEQFSSAVIQLF